MNSKPLPPPSALALHWVVGIPFLIAGWTKLAHPPQLADVFIYNLAWFPNLLATPVVLILGLLEIVTGCMLVTGFFRSVARKLATVLLGFFALYLSATVFLGSETYCQCYGQVVSIPPLVGLGLDIALLAILVWLERRSNLPPSSWKTFATVAIGIAMFTGFSNITPFLDSLLVGTKPGVVMQVLPTLHPQGLNKGKARIVVMTNRELSNRTIAQLEHVYQSHEVVVLRTSQWRRLENADPREYQTFPMKPALQARFVKSFPTCFLIENDEIVRVWYGHLPVL